MKDKYNSFWISIELVKLLLHKPAKGIKRKTYLIIQVSVHFQYPDTALDLSTDPQQTI